MGVLEIWVKFICARAARLAIRYPDLSTGIEKTYVVVPFKGIYTLIYILP